MSSVYKSLTERELKELYPLLDIERAIPEHIKNGWTLVSVSYVGGCRAAGHHVYHFIKEDIEDKLEKTPDISDIIAEIAKYRDGLECSSKDLKTGKTNQAGMIKVRTLDELIMYFRKIFKLTVV